MKDLTEGYPAKVIIRLALPLMFGYILQQLYNMADSKIVSTYVGTEAFAAVGATGVISVMIIGFINGLTQGFAIPIAQSFGAKDFGRMRKYMAGTIILTLLATLILTAFSLMFIENLLVALKTPTDIFEDAVGYVRIILAGIVFTALYNLCANVLCAVGDSRTPLFCLIMAVITNIVLDILFVKFFEWKIQGAACATIISQAISGILCLTYILVKFREILPEKESWKADHGHYSNLITSGLSMGLMSCIVNVGTVVLQGAINNLGTVFVAAHTAARRIFDVLTVSLYAVGVAMTTYVSQNMGSGRMDRVRKGVFQANIIVSIFTIVLIIICFLYGETVICWLTSSDDTAIINASVMYTRVSISFFCVLGPLFVLRCSLQGMGRKIIPVCSSILEMVIKIISAHFLVPVFAYKGVAFTEPISWILMLGLLASAYLNSNNVQ
ncbi:MAG: MATE family efflux transporter [Lachnospiraceae bacterium]